MTEVESICVNRIELLQEVADRAESFYAMVRGESPHLLEDDHNAMRLREALDAARNNETSAAVDKALGINPDVRHLRALLIEVRQAILAQHYQGTIPLIERIDAALFCKPHGGGPSE